MAFSGRTQSSDDEWAAELLRALVVGAAGVALLPALAVGVTAAEVMRWRGLRWTWALPPLAATAFSLWASRRDAVEAVRATAGHALAGEVEVSEIVWAGAPWWLVASCLVAVVWKLCRDRDDRYHGGERAKRLDRARGPAALAQAVIARRRTASSPYTPESGVLVGRDLHSERPVRLPAPRSMLTLIGASNSGKTTLASAFVEGMVDFGASLTALDPKASRATAHRCRSLAERHGRRFLLVSLEPFGDESLDRRRVHWNCVGHGNPTEVKDTILAAEDFSEPYYLATGERGVLAAASCLISEGRRPNAATLASLLEDPHELAARLERADRGRFGAEAAWLADLTKSEVSALRGIASRLARLVQSEGGGWLTPRAGEPDLDLDEAMRTGAIVLFSLAAGGYPAHASQLARYLTQQVNTVCGQVIRAGRPARAVFWIDDASGLAAGQLPALYERAREAGLVVMTAVQSLSNLATLGGERLHAAALDDAEVVAVLRQSLPGAADELAALAGTEEVYDHAHEVASGGGWIGVSDETGRRTRRLVERPRVSPEEIKRLGVGEAVLISKRAGLDVERIRIARAGVT